MDNMGVKRSRANKASVAPSRGKIPDVASLIELGADHSRLILVAEDDAVNQKVALFQLKDLGFAAHLVSNGEQALAAISQQHYALILMDCLMPVMDGVAATRIIRLREAQNGQHVPIIAMTAHVVEGAREECLSAGMDDFIAKPVTPSKLQEVVARWLPGFGKKDIASIIGFSRLEAMIGRAAATDVLRVYVTSTTALLQELARALKNQDMQGARAVLGELHSSCTVIGALSMLKMCERISALVGKCLWQSAWSNYQELCDESRRIDRFVKELLKTA